ncbi:MAG TPA: penicillin acylase family protein, partial [Parasegetibacter sp.]
INALRILNASQQFNLDKLIELGYDTYLAAFEVLIPSLLKAWENKKDDENYSGLKDAIEILRNWDLRCSETSVATTLAIEWGENLIPKMNTAERDVIKRMTDYVMGAKDTELLGELKKVLNKLQSNFGTWYVAWGEVNRYQRISGEPGAKYEDSKASLPVAFAASTWGCLPSYVSRYYDGTKKRYGYNGNTFICAVEFGKKLKAKSLLTGGVSGDPNSPHFTDQAELYSKGKFKDVLFYKEDILKNAVRKYKPGQ